MSRSNARRLIQRLESVDGAEVRAGRSGHLRLYYRGSLIGSTSSTPSDHRAWKNFLSDIRRAGFPTHQINPDRRAARKQASP